ncbi:MAG: response regulator [Thermodesulfobacteriota bacterium]|nr:response regulator [Thermodesulfobacteriota bacterium]
MGDKKTERRDIRDSKLILAGMAFSVLFWVLESAVHAFIFHEGNFAQQVLSPRPHEIWMRLMVMGAVIVFSVYSQLSVNFRRRAEKKARQAQAELDQIFDTAANGMRVVDKDFNVLRSNQTFSTLSGVSRNEGVGRKCHEMLRGPLCHTPGCPLMRILGGEKQVECEVEKERNDGVRVPCVVVATPFVGPDGELMGIVEDFKDISAHKQAEGELKKYTAELEQTRGKLEKQIWRRTGRIELNDRMRGEQDIETLGRNIIGYLANYLNAQVGAIYLADGNNLLRLIAGYAYNGRTDGSKEFEFGEGLVGQAALEKEPMVITQVPDDYMYISSGLGEAIPRNILVKSFLYEGHIKGVIELASFHVFTDTQLDFLNQVEESIAIAFHTAQSRFRMQELLEETQQQAEELQHQQEKLRETNEELEEQTHTLQESEARLQAQQEELRQANEELEEKTGALERQRDEIRKKNIELENSQELLENKARDIELTSKYKSEFLANMSHELRTPLNSILILSQLLSEDKGGNLSAKQVEFAHTIYSSGSDLLALINDVLDLSKVEAGKIELDMEALGLDDFSGTIARQFKPLAKEKGLGFKIDLAEGLPEDIRTDRQKLEQIIKNLLSNAIKFTTEGEITLHIHRPAADSHLSDTGLDPERVVVFSVSDTGIGIPEEKQKLIFEAFQQADGTTSRKYGGTGLGLSISRELTRLLGGKIELQSQEGKGSTFLLYLPEAVAEEKRVKQIKTPISMEAPIAPVDSAEGQGRGPANGFIKSPGSMGFIDVENIRDDRKDIQPGDRSILLIEDDPKFTKILFDIAHEKGFKCLVAGDGETGLHLADYYQPGGIILDIGLPGIDGWTVLTRLKDNSKTRHIPVHVISASDKTSDSMKMGAIGHITKPVGMDGLDNAFRKIKSIISRPVKHLLIVEDDPAQRKAIIELIGNGDVVATGVSTAQEAYELLKSGKFDCMILDLRLPDMSGAELLAKMRDDEGISYLPIIIYTGKELTKEEEITLNSYAARVILKSTTGHQRLLDETTLFLHRVEADLPEEKRKILRMIHDKEGILRGKTILLVDDDMRNVFALCNVLEEKGMSVLIGKNGKEGLERLNDNPDVDLVLMDIMMPEMDGYEAIKEIRKQDRFKKLPIIALTAKAMKGDRNKCIEAGASDYLAKPVDRHKLLSMLRVWLYL